MIKYFKDVRNLEDLRRQYKRLAHKLHPDCGGSAEAFREMVAEYETLFKKLEHDSFFTDFDDAKQAERKYDFSVDKEMRDVLNKIISLSGIQIEIIGSWLWVSGNTFPVREAIKAAGFKFSGNKKMWYWHAGEYRKKGRKMTIDAIRETFGTVNVELQTAPQLA